MTLHDTLLEATTTSFWKNQCREVHASTHPLDACSQPVPSALYHSSPLLQVCFPWAHQGAASWENLCGALIIPTTEETEAWKGSHVSKFQNSAQALQPIQGVEAGR